ncbi:hypothetical protein [Synechococcus phage S-B28]|jgi:hypothetical protein|uniref:Uncharacterized protein n=1 Tax=Synechococcus phage S-B28 TaxID=2545435 RepID=A0A482IG96_9CAUD|nr:hypothetical protein HOV28_gp40 [Synechococcus phage S-B28]QBP05835.1 hypothetical protein [Synechococcus phage S-B28]
MTKHSYGSVAYYEEMFDDILSDVENENVENIYQGFLNSLEGWFNYHDNAARKYAAFRQRVSEALSVS